MKIAIHDDCLKVFNVLKYEKTSAGHRYLVFKIDKEQVVLDAIGNKDQKWEDFIKHLPPKELRFGVFDLCFTNHDNMNIQKMIFINWNPDAAPLKTRLLYATAKENLRAHLNLNGKEINMDSVDEYNSEAAIIKEVDK